MTKVIALDYDGVIADTNQVKADWIAENLGLDVPPWLCSRTDCVPIIGLENYNRMSPIVYSREASLRARPIAGVLEAVQALRQSYRLTIVTARTEEQMQWSREWLARQGIEDAFEDIFSSRGTTKAEIVQRLGAVALIEDDIRHLRMSPEIRLARIHLTPYAEKAPGEPGIITARDWPAVLEALAIASLDPPSNSVVAA